MNTERARRERQLELVGVAEAAELLGLSKGALGERRRRPGRGMPVFPEPIVRLRCGPIWEHGQIARYRDDYTQALATPRHDDSRAYAAIDRALAALKPERARTP